ncbi:MAG: glycosyltransferase family 39 protein [Candidatus Nomurabacteria bacterium]|nr:MAG: glycosyltransferase family 39 protein [Candidatus Nomurabacteria bacterium]
MAKLKLTNFLTYRYRYQIGYILIVVTFLALLVVAGLFVPGGFSSSETKDFVQTSAMDLQNAKTLAIPNMPFFAAQRLSIDLFGSSTFAFKLPALICAFFTGIGAVLLLRRWFRPNIAVLATVIMITTGQFLYVAQSGSANITYIMWSVWLLLIATMITTSERHKTFWKAAFFIAMPLSLYTPMSIYLVLAIMSAGLLHPHVRYVLKKMSWQQLFTFLSISTVIALPLGYLVFTNPELILELVGAPASWPPNVLENLKIIFQQYFNFIHPQSGNLMTPVLDLGSMALIVLGIWQLFKIRYTARSYTLTAWIIVLIPILIINPTLTTVMFVPLLLLLANGLSYLLRAWYEIFPHNPYARFVGVVPLTILVGGLVTSGLYRYIDGYRYDPETANTFNHDLTLYNSRVLTKNVTTIVVTAEQQPFFDAVARYNPHKNIVVLTKVPNNTTEFAATRAAHTSIKSVPTRIITTDDSRNSDRFYIYKK